MAILPRALTNSFDHGERVRLALFYGAIVLIHVVGWGLLLSVAPQYPALVGLGGLAYSFGLRHAFDADHISAIDNTTRKLLQDGKRPVGVGFFFSIGHSSVVLVIALALGFAMRVIVDGVVGESGGLKNVGGLIGTSVSGVFLLLIGLLNLVILLDIIGVFRRMKRGEYTRVTLEEHLVTGGVLTRLFKHLFRVITESWQMYPIGFLFGLGFDTASEVALLAISAGAASQGLPFVAIISLPLIFAAGMSLMDTTDGAFMAKAYSWAFSNPIRKLFYNLTMTGLSVFVALFVGLVELAQIVVQVSGLQGEPWDAIAGFDLGSLGFIIVGSFVVAWAVAFLVFKTRRLEERWTAIVDA
ncbi:MAG TPA: HoxN/HupN/NixA family nickel/cobalt transporter [Chloroflexota bacterium]|nr:HoxN/HupN/NixA family nickel/cobalt transporter [Chloroflexota bacterium]